FNDFIHNTPSSPLLLLQEERLEKLVNKYENGGFANGSYFMGSIGLLYVFNNVHVSVLSCVLEDRLFLDLHQEE
ncbi:hypothetical protein M8C21_028469, partial [Ambrosia artemisiifolia]